jgi:hypothetical protein
MYDCGIVPDLWPVSQFAGAWSGKIIVISPILVTRTYPRATQNGGFKFLSKGKPTCGPGFAAAQLSA